MSEGTGRIEQALTPTARRIVFDPQVEDSFEAEIRATVRTDRAHLVMLAEAGIIDTCHARALLKFIKAVEATGFEELRGRPAPRGLYLLYESYLSEKLGAQIGGALHTGRSRNDLNATVLRLRLRAPFVSLLKELLLLQAIVLSRASRYSGVVMPAYTHFQPALPLSYGHYLAGVATALQRDISALFDAVKDIQTCPLGAGAGGGNTLPVDSARTAALLGFDHAAANSLDAVASRDPVLRLLASATLLGVTLSRLATDLLTWLSQEYGFLELPDRLVGSSSMMPQKRNPYLLEIVQGRAAVPLGGFVTAVAATQKTPFTNSISAGTEGVRPVWPALRNITEAATLARLVLAGARPRPEAMYRRAVDGLTTATEMANQLVLRSGMDFRAAHHSVGEAIRHAISENEPTLAGIAGRLARRGLDVSLEDLDPAAVVGRANYGGGPGAESLSRSLKSCREFWDGAAQTLRCMERKWRAADTVLSEAVAALCAGEHASQPRLGARPARTA
jgi:argininosuccinate lyase